MNIKEQIEEAGGLGLPAIRIHQNGAELYSVQLRPDLLGEEDLVKVDQWNPDIEVKEALDDQGYQRTESRPHYVKIAKYLSDDKSAFMPTSALVSVRKEVDFKPVPEHPDLGILFIPKDSFPLYIVDAQHRRMGLLYGIRDLGAQHLKDFCLPAVIMAGVSKLDEMKQFNTINSTSKRIDTDLAQRLLSEMAERDQKFKDTLISKKKKWLLRGVAIVDKLNELSDSPWGGRVQRPNRVKTGDVMIGESSLVTSLKPVLDLSLIERMSDEDVTKLLDRYWRAIMHYLPDANKTPRDFAIQKTTGCYIMHLVLPMVLEICRDASDYTENKMIEILSPVSQKSKLLSEEFWKRGGEAGTYSSSVGFQKVVYEMSQHLSNTAPITI